MDWTLIKTKSGGTFPKHKDDWDFLYGDLTITKLQELSKTYNIIIFTN